MSEKLTGRMIKLSNPKPCYAFHVDVTAERMTDTSAEQHYCSFDDPKSMLKPHSVNYSTHG